MGNIRNDHVSALLIAHLAGPHQHPKAAPLGVHQAAPPAATPPAERALRTIPPARPTPSTYIQPSWKSKICELKSEVNIFCTTTNRPIQLARPSPRNHNRCRS